MRAINAMRLSRLALVVLFLLLSVEGLFAQSGNRRKFTSEWSEVSCPVSDNLHLVHFHDNNRGWILTDSSGVLLGTRDGGTIWTIEDSLEPGYYDVLTTLKDNTLWIAGDKGHLLVRPVDGTSFSARGALRGNLALYDLMPVYEPGETTNYKLFASGVMVDGDRMKPWFGRSETRGRSWERLGQEFDGRFVAALARSSLGFLYAACEGSIYTSLTGSPNTWISIYGQEGPQWVIRDLEIDPDANGGTVFGLATGHEGLVLATLNGGRNWEKVEPFTQNLMRRALVLDTQVGWVVGDATNDAGVCWKTEDRAINWRMVQLPYADISLHDIAATEAALFAVGTQGTIYTMAR